MSDFGDIDPEDSFDASGTPEPAQVARRIHEIRLYLDRVTGTTYEANYDELTAPERNLADTLAAAVIEWLIANEPDNARHSAEQLHNVRRFLSDNSLPPWTELPEDQRAIGTALMQAIIDWLHQEGSI